MGVSNCISFPLFKTAIRLPSVIASTWSCVTYIIVAFISRCSFCNSILIWLRSFASRLESGSSNKKTFGRRMIALPIATRCRCPPDKDLGLCCNSSSNSSNCAVCITLSFISFLETPFSRKPKAIFSNTVM